MKFRARQNPKREKLGGNKQQLVKEPISPHRMKRRRGEEVGEKPCQQGASEDLRRKRCTKYGLNTIVRIRNQVVLQGLWSNVVFNDLS